MENKRLNSFEERMIHLEIWGCEVEYVYLDKDGEELDYFMSSLMAKGLYFYIDEEEVAEDPELPMNIQAPRVINVTNDVAQGLSEILKNFYKGCYSCDIQVKGEFDIHKITLNVSSLLIKINNWEYSDGPYLNSILYDGKEYDLELQSANGKGPDIIWGRDPQEDEDVEDIEEFEDPIAEYEYDNVAYDIYTDCAMAQYLVRKGKTTRLIIPDTITYDGKQYPVIYWGAGDEGVKIVELGKNINYVDALHSTCYNLQQIIIKDPQRIVEWIKDDGDEVSSAEECFPGVEIIYLNNRKE